MKQVIESEYAQLESFENIVSLASYICGTRAALINYLDHQQQWTLFNVGWENKQIPKKDSICQLAIESDKLLYIPNTDKDQRLKKIEAVQKDPKIKFYAGMSFKSMEGMTGTLCVIDDRPRELTDKQKEALKTLSSEVEARLNLISQSQITQKLKQALEEKEVMMMDIHHRVKNNFAVVSGLLQLESGFGDENTTNASLLNSISRIKSMAAIHEHLYKYKSFSSISFGVYITELVEIIENLYQDKSKKIKVNIHSDEMNLNINQAIPCALILSELISNSYKHAFKGRKHGRIDINMSIKDNDVDIIVTDNGVGIDKNKDPKKGSSLGLTLLGILSEQLHAEYNITSDKGTRIQLKFKREHNTRGTSENVF